MSLGRQASECASSSAEVGTQHLVVKARLLYLALNLMLIILCILCAIVVFGLTHSLTIELDSITLVCDALAVLINMVVELMKRRTTDIRSVLIFDLVGCLASLALLVGVAIFGLYDAVGREADSDSGKIVPRVRHLNLMIIYSSFSLLTTVLTLTAFQYWYDDMLPQNGCVHDRLNLHSSLAHTVVDFITSAVVVGTSIFQVWTAQEDKVSHQPAFEEAKDRVRVDVIGSFGVVACILVCVAVLVKEVQASMRHIRELPERPTSIEESPLAGSSKASPGPPGPKKSYGAVKV